MPESGSVVDNGKGPPVLTQKECEQILPARRKEFSISRGIVRLLNVTLLATPVAILSLFVAILAYSLTRSPLHVGKASHLKVSFSSAGDEGPILEEAPTLAGLLEDVTAALDNANVQYWLLPGLGLLPPSESGTRNGEEGRLNPWQEGIDIGVYQADLMGVVVAQTSLQSKGIVPVESYFGLRLYSIYGTEDDRYDFRTPFVDILYFKEEYGHAINFCCDCAPIAISACTKKTCGCLVCATKLDQLFPLSSIHIQDIRRAISCPQDKETLFLPRNIPGVHPAIFDM